jgi:response regulator RpfG family c-di-GMP phosphodiesterase
MTTTPDDRPRILLVDDDDNLLRGLVRLHGKKFDFTTVSRAGEAIQAVQARGPFAAVVCDYQMPGLKGAAVLAKIQALAPETVRVVMTGSAEIATAIDAVNRGAVFRFLGKPFEAAVFEKCLDDAVRQHQLLRSERALLEDTVRGAVQVMSEILSLVSPEAFGRAGRVHEVVSRVVAKRALHDGWMHETAALLFEIGLVAVPPAVLQAAAAGQPLTGEQRALLGRHPVIGSDLLRTVPRLEEVAETVRYQGKNFDGSGFPTDAVAGEQIPLGARILAAAIEYARLSAPGLVHELVIEQLRSQPGRFDPAVLDDLEASPPSDAEVKTATVNVRQLLVGHVLVQDIQHVSGTLIVPKGQTITPTILARLRAYAEMGHIDREVLVQERC